MKTSKVIFMTLLASLAILMIITAADIRLSMRKGKQLPDTYILTRQILPDYKILDIRQSRSIELVQGDTACIDLSVMKDSLTPKLNYQVSGDTLVLADKMIAGGRSYSVKIRATSHLQRIMVFNTTLNLHNFKQANLTVLLDHSRLIGYQLTAQDKTFKCLTVDAKNHSDISFSNLLIDTLTIGLQQSKAILLCNLNQISGNLTDSSRIELRQIDQISIKKDPSSQIKIYN